MSAEAFINQLFSSPGGKEFVRRYKTHYKAGNIWTLETGCLLFSSWMVYYLFFVSPETTGVLDIIVTIFFILGALTYVASSSMFNRLSQVYASSDWVKYLKTANRYLFMVLSFLPGLYYAFKYEHFILYVYVVIHFGTTVYFFYKRFKEFELEPFAIGVGMSVVLYFIGPFIRGFFGIFGSGWFITSLASLVESSVDLGLAVAFLLDLPRKHLPANMLFGLKIVKYFMCFLSWQTWFILMVFATWTNIGAGALSFTETYNAIEPIEVKKPNANRPQMPIPGSEKTKANKD